MDSATPEAPPAPPAGAHLGALPHHLVRLREREPCGGSGWPGWRGSACRRCQTTTVEGEAGTHYNASAPAPAPFPTPPPQVLRVIELAAPPHWQGLHLPPAGRRGIRPTLLACHPATRTQREEEAEEAAAAAAAAAAAQPNAQPQVAHAGGPAPAADAGGAALGLPGMLGAFIVQGLQLWGAPGGGGGDAGADDIADIPGLEDEEAGDDGDA